MENGGKKSKKDEVKISKSVEYTAESIIENALNLHATDVHIEPRENSTLIRFRIGGSLKNITELSAEMSSKLSKYFKKIGGLNFSEKTFPQTSTISHGAARIRISINPVFLGEKITLRLIRARKNVRTLKETGLWGKNLQRVQQALRHPRGIIFTVGDGKNTTNFALLNELNSNDKNIVTVEKSIEKVLNGINQTEINPKIGLNYLEMTQSALNQNPDVIYIDNLYEPQTADLIFNAAMSGKLIIASVPVSSSSEVIPFLNNLDIEPFLINANTLAIIGQNLVRTVPKKAIEQVKISKTESQVILNEFNISSTKLHKLEERLKLELKQKDKLSTSDNGILHLPAINSNISPELAFTGTTAIYEVISFIDGAISREIKSITKLKPTSHEVEEILMENQFTNLRVDGLLKVLRSETTLPELLRRIGF